MFIIQSLAMKFECNILGMKSKCDVLGMKSKCNILGMTLNCIQSSGEFGVSSFVAITLTLTLSGSTCYDLNNWSN